jgi:membrane protease YdiL (CAAX protease family)
MSTDPELFPPEPTLRVVVPPAEELVVANTIRRVRTIPNFGHMALFLLIAGGAVLITQLFAVGIAQGMHLFPHESLLDLAHEPRLILPTMFLSYFIAGILSVIIFTAMWRLPFAEGVRWDFAPIGRRGWVLVVTGVGLSIVVQLLSNFLPTPKELPIDEFFKTPLDVWLVAMFGVFIAPVFEELIFRGFVLPSLANTWDYVARRYHSRETSHLHATHFEHGGDELPGTVAMESLSPIEAFAPLHDPRWSPAALVFASVVASICFAMLHADQLAHAWSPLAVLFCVSLILCAVRVKWHSLAASALVHACYNATIFAMIFIATGGFRHLDKLKQ